MNLSKAIQQEYNKHLHHPDEMLAEYQSRTGTLSNMFVMFPWDSAIWQCSNCGCEKFYYDPSSSNVYKYKCIECPRITTIPYLWILY